jgi:hypothetical protein
MCAPKEPATLGLTMSKAPRDGSKRRAHGTASRRQHRQLCNPGRRALASAALEPLLTGRERRQSLTTTIQRASRWLPLHLNASETS